MDDPCAGNLTTAERIAHSLRSEPERWEISSHLALCRREEGPRLLLRLFDMRVEAPFVLEFGMRERRMLRRALEEAKGWHVQRLLQRGPERVFEIRVGEAASGHVEINPAPGGEEIDTVVSDEKRILQKQLREALLKVRAREDQLTGALRDRNDLQVDLVGVESDLRVTKEKLETCSMERKTLITQKDQLQSERDEALKAGTMLVNDLVSARQERDEYRARFEKYRLAFNTQQEQLVGIQPSVGCACTTCVGLRGFMEKEAKS